MSACQAVGGKCCKKGTFFYAFCGELVSKVGVFKCKCYYVNVCTWINAPCLCPPLHNVAVIKYFVRCQHNLHVFTLKILALKKPGFFPHKKYFPKILWLLFTFILCNFSVRTLKYLKKKWINFFSTKTLKNGSEKFLIIGPQPTAQNSY